VSTPSDAELLAEIYAALPKVECRNLCGGAYCGPIVVFAPERAAMERAGWPLPFRYDNELTCGFYDAAASRCRVHAARPLICRLFGAVHDARMVCPHGCKVERFVTKEEVQAMLDRLEARFGPPRTADGRVVILKGL
jgi:Fe-S-cluster containining protein